MLMLPPNKESLIFLTSASTYPEMFDLRWAQRLHVGVVDEFLRVGHGELHQPHGREDAAERRRQAQTHAQTDAHGHAKADTWQVVTRWKVTRLREIHGFDGLTWSIGLGWEHVFRAPFFFYTSTLLESARKYLRCLQHFATRTWYSRWSALGP